MSKTSILGILFLLAVLGYLVISTQRTAQHRVEVCITYQGRQACRTALASSKESAQRAATDNACAQIASGMTDSIACTNTPPDSVRWLPVE
ncbi:MAG: hypothetical protein WD696_13870 [Bryobacteraceae bacterium]